MAIQSHADHGYTFGTINPQEHVRDVRIGDTFRRRCALGIYESRVLRPHRDAGYFETVFERWVTEVPAFRQGFVGSIEVLSRSTILAAETSQGAVIERGSGVVVSIDDIAQLITVRVPQRITPPRSFIRQCHNQAGDLGYRIEFVRA